MSKVESKVESKVKNEVFSKEEVVSLTQAFREQSLDLDQEKSLVSLVNRAAHMAAARHPGGLWLSYYDDEVGDATVGILEGLKGGGVDFSRLSFSWLVSKGIGAITAARVARAREKLAWALEAEEQSDFEMRTAGSDGLRSFLRLKP